MSDDFDRWALLSDRGSDDLTEADRLRGGYYRTRTIRSGDMLEIEAYPMLPRRQLAELRRQKPSTDAQKRLNRRNAEKRFRRLAEINFRDHEDYFFTGTVESPPGASLPTLDQVDRILGNYVRRVNRLRKKRGLRNAKYLAVIEGWEEGARMKRLHVHMLLEGGLDRDTVEKLWNAGVRVKCERLIKSMLDQLCQYLLKDPRGRKRWKYSKGNLRQPVVRIAERKISSAAAWRIASDVGGRAAALERLYPGYRIDAPEGMDAVEVRTNPYVPGVFISARMRRAGPLRKKASRRKRKRADFQNSPGGGLREKGVTHDGVRDQHP